MFTGIVTEIGEVTVMDASGGSVALEFLAPNTSRGLAIGDSVAVNGVCLTVVTRDDDVFGVEAVDETMQRTNLGSLDAGAHVNLERPLAGDGRFDGHIVQGHVDGTGEIAAMTPEGDSIRIRIGLPRALARYVVEKGSVTVDGVSLTVTAVSPAGAETHWFEIVLIPHTLQVTVFGRRRVGDRVNVETDILAKYMERLMEHRT